MDRFRKAGLQRFRETPYVIENKEDSKMISHYINVNNSKEKEEGDTYKGMAALRCPLTGPEIEE